MSGLIKQILRPSYLRTTSYFFSSKPILKTPANQLLSRSMWNLSYLNKKNEIFNNYKKCNCGCQNRFVHAKGGDMSKTASKKIDQLTEGEKELAEFLTEEIAAEQQLQKKSVSKEVGDFKVLTEGPEVTLVRKEGDEEICIKFNVNHSAGEETDYDSSESGQVTKDEDKQIVNRPPFDVEIKRNGQILGFRCSIMAPTPPEMVREDDAYNDLFTIDEVVLCNGEWTDSEYHVPGEIMDGTLYDLLMNFLEDKGINNDFVTKLTKFSTDYEHSLYIKLLENMKKFVSQAK